MAGSSRSLDGIHAVADRLEMMTSLPSFFISEVSCVDRSKEMSASPRSIRARRLPCEGIVRQIILELGQLAAHPVVIALVDHFDAGLQLVTCRRRCRGIALV